MDKQLALKEIDARCVEMRKLYDECINIAKAGQVAFSLPWGGEGRSAEDGCGAGATFYPEGVDDYNKYSDYAQWVSSSQTC